MAIKNPQGNFNFKLALDGVDNARVQVVTAPSVEWAVHKQGTQGNSPDQKTPGKKQIGELVVKVLVPMDGDGELWDKLEAAQTMDRAQYCGDGFLYETDQDGATQQTFKIVNAWISKVETEDYDTKADNSADLIRTVTFQVEDYRKV